ncbi:MAG: hypothetical protein IPK82_20420 [Polyangiaceae bacterium]|nr:hypothetical protein [Polyangiaceae bacterium]MBK8255010.1 hypothetical protein [Polyangiaceae bacterium]
MTITALENLARSGQLRREDPAQEEIDGLLRSGARRLQDAENTSLSLESRFDLAYNAAHALALGGLRWRGYRSDNRYIVFQVLPHTLSIANEKWRVLDQAHRKRNQSEYDGVFDIDAALVEAVIRVAREVETALRALGAVKE